MSNTPDQDQISLLPALKALVVIAVLIRIGMGFALTANTRRRLAVITTYTSQTEAHYQANQSAYRYLFTTTFSECQTELKQLQASESAGYKSSDVQCRAAVQQLASMHVNALPDSSAIAYVKITNDTYELIEASGKYNESRSIFETNRYNHFSYEAGIKQDLARYFKDHSTINRWQDFINYIGGKEVIVPIQVDDQPIGYVFRGVIER